MGASFISDFLGLITKTSSCVMKRPGAGGNRFPGRRARGEVASLKEFNERLVDGLREGLELVDGDFTIRHANRWMSEQFGPVIGRHCYEVPQSIIGSAPVAPWLGGMPWMCLPVWKSQGQTTDVSC